MYNSYPMDALIFALLQFSLILVGSALKAQCVCVCLSGTLVLVVLGLFLLLLLLLPSWR